MTSMSLALVGVVGLAGAVGALARYVIGRYIAERYGSQFPLGTLLINVTGAFLIGLLLAFAGRNFISSTVQTILATGFLGGYTTFSTMSWEGVQVARGGSTRTSLLYFGSNLVPGLLAAALGLLLGWWL
jgi:CrcB protein